MILHPNASVWEDCHGHKIKETKTRKDLKRSSSSSLCLKAGQALSSYSILSRLSLVMDVPYLF